MTWAEALHKGHSRWIVWAVIGSVLGCGFLIKGGTQSDFLWGVVIGAANGAAIGFALGPAAEKGAIILSGLLTGAPFYLIAASALVIGSVQVGGVDPDDIVLVSIFVIIGVVFSLAQSLRMRGRTRNVLP